jgi:transposase
VNTVAGIPSMGIKAYVSRTISQKLRNHNIRLISPLAAKAASWKALLSEPKKRSPRVLSNSDKTILKSRCKIEHVFCRLDKFRRIHCRESYESCHEKNLNSYAALNFLAMAIIVCKKLRD